MIETMTETWETGGPPGLRQKDPKFAKVAIQARKSNKTEGRSKSLRGAGGVLQEGMPVLRV